jgi:hypothetical protein
MNARLTERLKRLESKRGQAEAWSITRIIISPAGDDDPLHGVVMEKQADGTWQHKTTKEEPPCAQ